MFSTITSNQNKIIFYSGRTTKFFKFAWYKKFGSNTISYCNKLQRLFITTVRSLIYPDKKTKKCKKVVNSKI